MTALSIVRPPLGRLRRRVQRIAAEIGDGRRHRAIARTPKAPRDKLRVFYGHDRIPRADEPAHGGMIKFQSLDAVLPNAPRDFNLLYLGSSTLPRDAETLVALAGARGAAIAWNQNGVAYRGHFGDGFEAVNRRLRVGIEAAEHVFFQSGFCKLSSDRFLGEPKGAHEILHNPVDTERFVPADRRSGPLTLLLGGNQYQRYRFEAALETLEHVRRAEPEARLLVTGVLSWHPDRRRARLEGLELVKRLGLEHAVELAGTYTQAQAPAVMRRAQILLHPKYNDPCPTIVLEAMSSGLPVVYSASGGTPELVGEAAGVGVEAPLDFERDHPPAPDALAAAVLTVWNGIDAYAQAARARAVDRFDLRQWLDRHRVVFSELVR